MFKSLMSCLRCPEGGELKLKIFKNEYHAARRENEITEGLLVSRKTKNTYPVWNGIPRLLPTSLVDNPEFCQKYESELREYPLRSEDSEIREFIRNNQQVKARFEYQWARWDSTKMYGMTADEWRTHFFDCLTPESVNASFLRNKTVLEVGCGPGMLARALSPSCKEYIGLDLGAGVDVARQWTHNRPKVSFVQGDIMTVPLKQNSFDVGLALGVLHRTPKTSEAFFKIAPLVRKAGSLIIWVCPRRNLAFEISNRALRFFTTRFPPSGVYYVSYLMTPLLLLHPPSTLNRIGKSSAKELAQSVFDWLSPPYQWHHSPEEVISWYEQTGYENIEFSKIPLGAMGVRSR